MQNCSLVSWLVGYFTDKPAFSFLIFNFFLTEILRAGFGVRKKNTCINMALVTVFFLVNFRSFFGVPRLLPSLWPSLGWRYYGRPLSWQHRLNYGSHSNDLMIPQDLRRTTGTLQRHHQASEQFYIPKIDIVTIDQASSVEACHITV